MKILLLGDSINEGSVGVSWIKLLASQYPSWNIENRAKNGATICRVYEHALKFVTAQSNYDFIIIAVGANDILIPSFAGRGFFFRQAYQHLIRNGYSPRTLPKDFEHSYHELIHYINVTCKSRIILLTIGCINENLSTPLNRARSAYNEIIRDLAWDRHCPLADIATEFDKQLRKTPGRDYLLNNFFDTTWFDRQRSLIAGRADKLARTRGLQLTIDGLHPNSRGARIIGREVEKQLLTIS